MVGHATHRPRVRRGPLLSREQSRQRPCGGLPQSGRLPSLLPAPTGGRGAHVDATAGGVPDAESFPPRAVAQAGW